MAGPSVKTKSPSFRNGTFFERVSVSRGPGWADPAPASLEPGTSLAKME